MAKSDKVKQLNKIEVNNNEVIINDLVIQNEELSQYIVSAENKEQALMEVISLGVQTLNTLKNSIEKDYTKKIFEEMSESMDKTLDTTLTSIQDEFNNYFDDEDGSFIKELNDSSSELSKTLKEEFENFLDPGIYIYAAHWGRDRAPGAALRGGESNTSDLARGEFNTSFSPIVLLNNGKNGALHMKCNTSG